MARNDRSESGDSPWGDFGVLFGAALIGAVLYAGHPNLGAGAFGRWRTVGLLVGLTTVGLGLASLLRSKPWPPGKIALVATTVATIATGAFYGVEQVPTSLPPCGAIEKPSPDNPATVYCNEGDGLLKQISLRGVNDCGGYTVAHSVRQESGEWATTWDSFGCSL